MEDRLQKFAVLAEAESFTKAAALLHMSQPALTVAVQKLERELHAELLVPAGRSFRLTSAGRLAYLEGKELLARRKNLKLQLANLQSQKSPLAIGMIDSVADLLLDHTDALEGLERTAEVSLSVNNSAALVQALRVGQLDVAVVAGQQGVPSHFQQIPIGAEPLVFVTHRALRSQVETDLSQGALSHFLSYNQASTTYQLVQSAANRAQIALQPSFYSTSPEIILKQVLSQKGVAVLPQLLVGEHIAEKTLVPVFVGDSCIVKRNIIALKQAKRLLPPATQTMLDQISATLARQMAIATQYDIEI